MEVHVTEVVVNFRKGGFIHQSRVLKGLFIILLGLLEVLLVG
jgi:hypothetical protein